MSYILFTLLLVFTLGDLIFSQDANIQLSTNPNYQIDKLKFGCSPSGNWGSITRVSLSKNSSTGFKEFVAVYLDAGGVIQNKTVWHPTNPNWQNRVTIIKQYVNPKTGAGLEFDISPSQTLCSDEGTYSCAVTGTLTDGQTQTHEKTGTVTLTVKANSVNQVTLTPQMSDGFYTPYSVVVLSCNGQVGNPPENLRWCYRKSSEPTGNFQGWLNPDDIVNSDPISFGCQNTQTSRLTFNVTAEDPYTEFKCETGYQNLRCGHSSIISSNITIYRYTAPAVNKPQTDDTASGGVIAGAVIGSFVGIILIVVIVYFVAFRKKNEGETYRTKEENGTGSAPIDNTVYSVPNKERHGDRDRSPREKSPRQYENRGLDEPHTRGYNADPRGRSNPGMDRSFDDVRDGNMKSSRGPMMGSNASFGSAV